MFGIQHFPLFALAVLLINITPGITFLTVSSYAVTGGTKTGIITSLGASCGLLFYAILSWAGLSTLLAQSTFLFNILRYAGVVYLFYNGIHILLRPAFKGDTENKLSRSAFKKGLLVNLLNPFSIVLFLSLIPQFINREIPQTALQVLIMGLWICLSAFTVNIMWAVLFGWLGKQILDKPVFWKGQKLLSGFFFIYLAIKLAFLK